MQNKLKIILSLFIAFLFLSSCSGLKNSRKSNNPDVREKNFNFNYYFLEANKQKLLGNFEGALNNYNAALKIDKDQAVVYYEIAGILNLMKDFSGALEYAQKAVSIDKTNNEFYRLLLAFSYQNNNMQAKVTEVYEDLIKIHPEKIEYYFELANMYARMDKVKDALKVLNNVEKRFGIIDVVSLEKEKYYLYLEDKENATKEVKKLSEAYPDNVKYKTILGEAYINAGNIEAAKKVYEELENSDIDEGILFFSLADFYRMTKNYDKSFQYLAKGFEYDDIELDFKIKLVIGIMDMMGNDKYFLDKTKYLLDVLKKEYPEDVKVKALYSDYYVFVGDYKSAQKELDDVLKKEKDKYQIWTQALYVDYSLQDMESMYNRGKEAVELYPNYLEFYKYYIIAAYFTENYEDVINAVNYASILAVNNQSVLFDFLSMQGDAYHKMGNNHESDSVFNIILKKDKDYVPVLNNYSYFLAIRGENLDKALEMSTRLISLEKKPSFLDTHAWVLFKKGEYEKALDFINQAISMDLLNAVFFEHKGDILYKLGKSNEALEMWQKAKEIGGGSELLEEKIETKTLIE